MSIATAPTVPETPETPERLVTDDQLAAQGIPVSTVALATIGGGLGSFALVDRLRIGGVPATEIAVLGPHRAPGTAFLARCRSTGLDSDDRLRSGSSARIDNLWGFPGYAAGEARRTRRPGALARSLADGIAAEAWSPTVGQVQAGLEREAWRIGWSAMTTGASAEYLFKRADGGYFVITRAAGKLAAVRCDHVHLALGAAAPAVPPASAAYLAEHPEDTRIRHASEDHEQTIDQLAVEGGAVLVLGTGMAATQALERIAAARARHGSDIHIWHVMRQWPAGRRDRREGFGFSHQDLDFPRSAYGGGMADQLRDGDEDERLALIETWGATSTPYRHATGALLEQARTEGWYDAVVGEVERYRSDGPSLKAGIRLEDGERLTLDVDHVIDATGLERDARGHGLVADLLAFSPVSTNRLGGLRVDEQYAVIGGRSGDGLMFASGVTALGGHYGPVDTFDGMQHAAFAIADELSDAGLGNRLTPWRSLRGWLGWMGGKAL